MMARKQKSFGCFSADAALALAEKLLAQGERVRACWTGDGSFHAHTRWPIVRWGSAIRHPMTAAELRAKFGAAEQTRQAKLEMAMREMAGRF